MHHALPVRGCSACRMRYSTGSRRLMLPEAMSILARSTRAPFGNSPARMVRACTIRKFTGPHAPEQVEVFTGAAIAVRAVAARLGQGAAHRPHLLGRRVVDKGVAVSDQVLGPVVKLLEIIGGMIEVPAPIKAETAHIPLDRADVFLFLLGWVR